MATSSQDGSVFSLFGFELVRKKKDKNDKDSLPSVVPPTDEDGSPYVGVSGSHFAQFVSLGDVEAKTNAQLVNQYRGVAMHPEVDDAIENIVNEAVSVNDEEVSVELKFDDKAKLSDGTKKKITDEFETIVSLLHFNEFGHDLFKRWYVDGRLYHHLVVEKGREREGIQDIRPLDAAKTRKVKEVLTGRDPKTGAKIVTGTKEYFVYQDKPGSMTAGTKLTPDSVSYVTSGIVNPAKNTVISYLHKALKAVNQLRMMEDSLVIYRLARAPERRIFYIDVGSLPNRKAEEYMRQIMSKYRNKIVYDAETGNIKDDRKQMSMLEDFWLPRREGGRGTEIETLPGGENLSAIDDVVYFQKKLFRSLNVPISRMDTENAVFNLGRSNEISRDELKFQKFIDRLRRRFSSLFTEILKKQLILKSVIVEEDWAEIKDEIQVHFVRDNYYSELKETEIVTNRLNTLTMAEPFIGSLVSKEWIYKKIMMMTDDEIKEMRKQIDEDAASDEASAPPDDAEEQSPPPPPPPAPPVNINIHGAEKSPRR